MTTLERLDSFDALGREWADLAARAGTIFATPVWLATWWRHFGRDRPLHLFACRDGDGRLAAILPLYEHRARTPRVLRFVGHGPSDQLGPLCLPADRELAAGALLQALAQIGGDLMLGEQFPGDQGWESRLGGRVLGRDGSPVLHFSSSVWEEVTATFTPSVARNARRDGRRLEREHDVAFRLSSDPDRLSADLDVLFDLHRARWGAGVTRYASEHEAFHRDFAAQALDRGWLRLLFLEVDGRAVAAIHDMRFGGRQLQYQQGRDPGWDHRSVGFLTLIRAMADACGDGMSDYCFLRGDEAYKYRYATADPGVVTIGVGHSGLGQAALAATGIAPRRVLAPVRRWLAS